MLLGRVLLASFLLASLSVLVHLRAGEVDCSRTSNMRVYSSAFVHKETGDLLGYELAIDQAPGSTTDVLFFIHEGSPGEGIPLTGRVQDGKLVVEGEWVEHLIEYPSKREIVQKHSVSIRGTLDEDWFRGTIAIEGLTTPDKIRLRRVRQIWMCRGKVAAGTPKN